MFGYVRPVRAELKCRDFDLYRATYCGLCRCLRRRYGLLAPMFLNYDFTFLALLLWPPETDFPTCYGRCQANPLRKEPMCLDSPALEQAADESIILAWWKLNDNVQDNGLLRGFPYRALLAGLYPAYRKAARLRPAFDRTAQQNLQALAQLEAEGCPSMDRAADAFAKLLQAAAPQEGTRSRVLSQLLYHLGRWIYLLDARDDLAEDLSVGRYNAVAARFGPEGDDACLRLTLDQSLRLMGAAFQLEDFGCRTAVLENILYLGLPLVQRAVFDGTWSEIKKQKIWSNRR